MSYARILLPLAAALCLSACSSDSSLPEATGKGIVRAINAIPRSPGIEFLIEERSLDIVPYQRASGAARYDDLTYRFNFEVRFIGDAENTRIASREIDVVADQDYTFLLTGSVAAPSVTVWESSERVFESGETVFQARFAHTAPSLAGTTVDVYFAPQGVAPAIGEEVATLEFGAISEAQDFAEDSYVVTLTTAGDVGDVLYVSSPVNLVAQADLIISPFDGDANDVAPIVVRGLGTASFEFAEPGRPSQIQFLHASTDSGVVDVYDDEPLTSMLVNDLAFRELTPEMPLGSLNPTYYYTPFDSTATVFVEQELSLANGTRYRAALIGTNGDYSAVATSPDRAPFDTMAKVFFGSASSNFELLSLYVMAPGEVPDETTAASQVATAPGNPPPTIALAAGTYDLYVSESGADDFALLAGPFTINVAFGDVVDLLAVDNPADPAVIDFLDLSTPP